MTVEALAGLASGPTVLAVFLLALAEKFLPVLPSSGLLVFLGTTLVAGPGDLILIVGAATLGSSLGCLSLYVVGKHLGDAGVADALARYRFRFLDPARYDHMVRKYRRHHFQVTLVGQIVPAARAILPLSAGLSGMAPGRFMLAVMLGASVWNGCFLSIGYILYHGA